MWSPTTGNGSTLRPSSMRCERCKGLEPVSSGIATQGTQFAMSPKRRHPT
jgi:hypothetical protein